MPRAPFGRILVVCVGNICRSPMAEAVLRQALLDRGREVEVRSAGIGALVGYPADDNVRLLLERRGIDVSGHRAIQVNRDLLYWADLILVMEDEHRLALHRREPSAAGKVFLLGHWIDAQIPDPYRAPLAVFEETLDLVDRAVASWVQRL
jgi:protein-tyrosine phosphatase